MVRCRRRNAGARIPVMAHVRSSERTDRRLEGEPVRLSTPVARLDRCGIPYVGTKLAARLAAATATSAGCQAEDSTVEDLLSYVPFRYEDRSNLSRINMLEDDADAAIEVTVEASGGYPVAGGRFRIFDLSGVDETGRVRAFWWNQLYLASTFKPGTRAILFGRWRRNRKGILEAENPEYEVLPPDDDAASTIHTGRRVPIYRKFGEFRTRQLRRIIFEVIARLDAETDDETLPPSIVDRHGFVSRLEALRRVHFPENDEPLRHYAMATSAAHRRIIYEEFFWVALALAARRGEREMAVKGPCFETNERVRDAVRSILPFKPTAAQKRVLREIVGDMTSRRPMNRLLQGDVGSGKTIVAVQAMVVAVENGYQTALMVPTELLAEQHARTIKRTLAPTPYRVELLTGSATARQKRALREALAAGEIDVAVGTHALIQAGVVFPKLGLVVIDEQHRFGVVQRAELIRRGYNPDVLVMTATPIPRSLAMTVYGDLDVSVIDELPPGRTPVTTRVRSEEARTKIYRFVDDEIRAGRQVYVVYPLVSESEKMDLLDATAMADHLQREVFPTLTVGLVHGRMKSDDKDAVMRRFVAGEIDILVATTVIEVGMDVPNATVMIVEHAERFGLSQLHQLRGRVGRGAGQSYCILLAGKKRTTEARARLAIMEATTDGFRIAEKDLELRGPGELLGTRQHGIPAFRVGNIVRDREWLEIAKTDADALLGPKRRSRDAIVCLERLRAMPRFGLATVG